MVPRVRCGRAWLAAGRCRETSLRRIRCVVATQRNSLSVERPQKGQLATKTQKINLENRDRSNPTKMVLTRRKTGNAQAAVRGARRPSPGRRCGAGVFAAAAGGADRSPAVGSERGDVLGPGSDEGTRRSEGSGT